VQAGPQVGLDAGLLHDPAPSYEPGRTALASSGLAEPRKTRLVPARQVAGFLGATMNKRDFLQGLLAVSVGGWLSAGEAQVVIQVAPPPPREERMPGPRRNMVWVPGYWDWNGRRHVWRIGHWVKARRGFRWRQDRWVEHDGGWRRERGGWDRDGDGVPNRMDSRPNNPNRN
jgi:hypothetical protein